MALFTPSAILNKGLFKDFQKPRGGARLPALDPSILRAYDIRGVVGETLTKKDAYSIGRAFAIQVLAYFEHRGPLTISVGYDGRESSPAFKQALIKGINDSGVNAIDLGCCPTPLSYFSAYYLDTDATVMITGSHNPKNYNGFKLTVNKRSFFGEDIQKLGKIIRRTGTNPLPPEEHSGQVETRDIKSAYIARILEDLDLQGKQYKIAWDCGNGAVGTVIHDFVNQIPGEHVLLYDDVDGNFPNHHPDPTVEKNLQDLKETVLEKGCDFGFAFDGDGDRIGFVTGTGEILWCDTLIGLYAQEILARKPGAPIIGDVKCSNLTFDMIAKAGGDPLIWKTGHSSIKSKMVETGAPLAGELSGHIFFADGFYGYDDVLYAAVRLINIIAASDDGIEGLIKDLPTMINTPEVRLEVKDSEKFEIVERVRKLTAQDDSWRLIDIDGVRGENELGWWILRASNTQNVLSIRAEARDNQALETLKSHVNSLLTQAGAPTAY